MSKHILRTGLLYPPFTSYCGHPLGAAWVVDSAVSVLAEKDACYKCKEIWQKRKNMIHEQDTAEEPTPTSD